MNLENGLTPAPGDEYSRAFIALLRNGSTHGSALELWRKQLESLASSKGICLLALAGVEQATVPDAELTDLSAGLESRAEQLHKCAQALLADWPDKCAQALLADWPANSSALPPNEFHNMEFMQSVKEIA